jgi:NADH-quinone oxidoreductase subunit J
MTTILFVLFAAVAIVCGINVVLRKHPVESALALIGTMASLSVIYLQLGAQFIAAAQVFVYAGAIMVLFTFVIMLVNAGSEEKSRGAWMARLAGGPLLVALIAILGFVVWRAFPHSEGVWFGGYTGGTAENVGRAIFTTYLLPFEITSLLVLIAIVGAVVLGYKELE